MVLLLALFASRYQDDEELSSTGRPHSAGSSLAGSPLAAERRRAAETPHDKSGKIGGIWFW
jgi:hypothetical protein